MFVNVPHFFTSCFSDLFEIQWDIVYIVPGNNVFIQFLARLEKLIFYIVLDLGAIPTKLIPKIFWIVCADL